MIMFIRRVHAITSRRFSVEVEKEFKFAVRALKEGDSREVSNEAKLKIYAYFKQGSTGPCDGKNRPGLFDPVGRAKFDAWKSLGNMTTHQAMNGYVEEVKKIYDGKLPILDEPSIANNSTHVEDKFGFVSMMDAAFPRNTAKKSFDQLKLKTIQTAITATGVAEIRLHRPNRGNSMNFQMWNDIREVFAHVQSDKRVKVVVLTGSSTTFCTGMDLEVFGGLKQMSKVETCEGRIREAVGHMIQFFQDVISLPEVCAVPVIAQISGHCIGGAVDLATACDMRYCTKDAVFCVKETDLAMVADIGTLQRLPHIVGDQRSRELTYTARNVSGSEAEEMGLVLQCFDTDEQLRAHVSQLAEQIAAKSSLTTRGIKKTLLYTRDHSVRDALEQIKLWNSAHLLSNDLSEVFRSAVEKTPPKFSE